MKHYESIRKHKGYKRRESSLRRVFEMSHEKNIQHQEVIARLATRKGFTEVFMLFLDTLWKVDLTHEKLRHS